MKIKKGDTVVIIAGKNRAKTGKVLRVFPKTGNLFVEGVFHKKHKRSRAQGKKGEIIMIPTPLSSAVVKLICPRCGKSTRIGYEVSGNAKARVCKKCKKQID